MSAKSLAAVGSVRPRSAGSAALASLLPSSKVQKVSRLRWSDNNVPSSENDQELPAIAAGIPPREPMVIRKFDASSTERAAVFTCTSGELLWGHLHTVIEGSKSQQVDSTSGTDETGTGGTIIQQSFRYRAKARKGTWKAEPAFIGDWHIGYVCYHEDLDGLDVLRQAADVGLSNSNDHENRQVVYVNRYDWGGSHDPGLPLVLETLELGLTEEQIDDMDEELKYFEHMISGRFMLLDPRGLPTLIQTLKEGEKLARKNYLFHYPPSATGEVAVNGAAKEGEALNPEAAMTPVTTASEPEADPSAPPLTNGSLEGAGNGAGSAEGGGAGKGAEAGKLELAAVDSSAPFGVNLVTINFEYELGWMLFEEGELVGFVYDGVYSSLESESSDLKLGGTVVTGLHNSEGEEGPPPLPLRSHDSEDEEDEPYCPSSATESTDSDPSMRYYVGSETESEAGSQATSGQTAASKEIEGGGEEQGEECISKEISSSAPKTLETIHEEEDGAEPSEGTPDAPPVKVVEHETAMAAAAPPGPSSLS